jgi:hypothetical protein
MEHDEGKTDACTCMIGSAGLRDNPARRAPLPACARARRPADHAGGGGPRHARRARQPHEACRLLALSEELLAQVVRRASADRATRASIRAACGALRRAADGAAVAAEIPGGAADAEAFAAAAAAGRWPRLASVRVDRVEASAAGAAAVLRLIGAVAA